MGGRGTTGSDDTIEGKEKNEEQVVGDNKAAADGGNQSYNDYDENDEYANLP